MRLIHPPLIRKEQIQQKVSYLAEKIRQDIRIEYLHVITVLNGAVFFATDLLRELPPVASVDFIKAQSYCGSNSSGNVRIHYTDFPEITGKQVLIIEDILDTGLTTQKLWDFLMSQSPEALYLCVLLEKKKQRTGVTIMSNYVGFHIEDKFVVGYGMDYNGKFRNLPDIYILDLNNNM